jgi:UPF0042 nucleotide-binding protein
VSEPNPESPEGTDPEAEAPEPAPAKPSLQLIVVTGLSGSGISTALNALEDLGWFCVDNLPPPMLTTLIEMARGNPRFSRLALGLDARNVADPEGVLVLLEELGRAGVAAQVLFLEASDDALLRRFSASRRPHPLAREGLALPEAIRTERARMFPFRERATEHLDTTDANVHECKRRVQAFASRGEAPQGLAINVMSFGFRHGVPTEADIVWDVRFLPNPHFVPALQPHSGLTPPVAEYVLSKAPTQRFLSHFLPLLDEVLPAYEAEGKTRLTVAIGCTGGRHRSVAIAEKVAQHLVQRGRTLAGPGALPGAGGAADGDAGPSDLRPAAEASKVRHRDIDKETR